MTAQPDCAVLEETLDALFAGRLSPVELEEFRRHARSCRQCAGILQLHEHLAPHSREEAEAGVSDELADTMWPRVLAGLAPPRRERRGRFPTRAAPKWMTPALAAAAVVLLACSVVLLAAVAELRERRLSLEVQLADLEQRYLELDARRPQDPALRAAQLAGTSSWERALQRRRVIRVSELQRLLRSAPPDRLILDPTEARTLSRYTPSWAGTAIGQTLAGIDIDDGIQADELLLILDRLEVEPGTRIRTSELFPASAGT